MVDASGAAGGCRLNVRVAVGVRDADARRTARTDAHHQLVGRDPLPAR